MAATPEKLRHAAKRERFALLAYCFMPDHLPLLVEGTDVVSDLQRFVFSAKQSTGYAYRRQKRGRLWQEGYYDHVLRHDESIIAKARYILENPVRAGLVRAVDEYPFSGSDVHSVKQLAEAVQDWR